MPFLHQVKNVLLCFYKEQLCMALHANTAHLNDLCCCFISDPQLHHRRSCTCAGIQHDVQCGGGCMHTGRERHGQPTSLAVCARGQ